MVIVTGSGIITGMEVMDISKDSVSNAGAGSGFEFPDYSKADRSELLGLMAQADLYRRQVEAYLVGLVVRFGELEGRSAAVTVCHQLNISAHRARQLARTAEGLAAMPEVLSAAEQGLISADQAGLVAESHKRTPMSDLDQQELVELGGWQGQDEFKKTVAAREDQRRADDGMGRAERQRARRSAKVFDGAGGMVVLHAELEQVAGERVKAALCSMSSKMLGYDIAHDPIRTFEQRNADALVALITQQPAAGTASQGGGGSGPGGMGCEDIAAPAPQKTVLVVSADYDAITGQLENCGLIDGTPIELDELRRLACDAEILPMIFSAKGQPIYAGRTRKAVTRAQKLALYRRDRGCIGCGIRPQACDAHHILPWEHNGPTDITNLVLLCPKCHAKVHKHGHTIENDPETGRYKLRCPDRPSRASPGRPPRQHQSAA